MNLERFKHAMVQKKITREQLAKEVGVSHRTVESWEYGLHEPPNKKLVLLAQALDCTTDYLLGNTEIERLDRLNSAPHWHIDQDLHGIALKYCQLDDAGLEAINSVILREFNRCKDQRQLTPPEDIQLTLFLK